MQVLNNLLDYAMLDIDTFDTVPENIIIAGYPSKAHTQNMVVKDYRAFAQGSYEGGDSELLYLVESFTGIRRILCIFLRSLPSSLIRLIRWHG